MSKKKLPGCVLVLLWGIGALFVLTLLVGLLGRLLPEQVPERGEVRDPLEVSRATWAGEWPLSVESGRIVCREPSAVYFRSEDGRLWPVNGMADSHAERHGTEPSIDPVWLMDEEAIESMVRAGIPREDVGPIRVSIGGMIDYGLEVCRFD